MKFSEDVGQNGPAGGKKHLPSGALGFKVEPLIR